MQKRVRKNSDFICPKKPKLDISVNSGIGKNDTSLSQIVKVVNNKSTLSSSNGSECGLYCEKKLSEAHLDSISKAEKNESHTIEINNILNKNDDVHCTIEVSTRNMLSGSKQMQDGSDIFKNQLLVEEHENKNVETLNFSMLQGESDSTELNVNLNSDKTILGAAENASSEGNIFLTETSNTRDQIDLKCNTESIYTNKKNTSEFQIIRCNSSKQHSNNAANIHSSEVNISDNRLQSEPSTAKVSLGNTTISVPLLKPLTVSRILKNENIVRNVINIRGKKIKATPTIVQLSQVHINPKTNSKIVQATLLGNKVQLPNVEFKPAGSYAKANITQTTQCSTVAVTSSHRQGFEEGNMFTECNTQNKTLIDRPFKHSENTTLSVLNSKETASRNVSYSAQLRVINSSPNSVCKSPLNDAMSHSVTVTASSDIGGSKVCSSLSKPRKPIVLSKTLPNSEIGGDVSDIYLSNDNQHITENSKLRQMALAVQNGNRIELKVTKCTDEAKSKRNERITDSSVTQQQKNTIKETISNYELLNVEKSERQNVKSDETQNVLLKHLLQSSSSQRTNNSCSQTLAPRKLAPVRAPSLGVVSSLEAQLARPVIPPVSSVGDMKTDLKLIGKNVNDKLKKNTSDNNSKSRLELISRETSFLSTISLKQGTTDIQEFDVMNGSHISNNQVIDAERNAAQLQSLTKSNNSNLYKCKQNEMENGNFRTMEVDTNQTQIKTKTHLNDFENQMIVNNGNSSVTNDASSATIVKSNIVKLDIEQNIELRKKMKRDCQKHKRLLLNKDSLSYQRKKSRKVSKASEDYDEFIDNKVIQIKQMFILEVLEPLLNTFLGICSLYGYNDKVRSHVEHSYHHAFKDDFGKTNLKNSNDFYSNKPFGSFANKMNKPAAFQNKFYDEEFPAINNDTCDKFFQLISVLKQQNIHGTDNISYTSSSQWHEGANSASLNMSNLGIKFSKYINLNTDRMSPIISLIKPDYFGTLRRKKTTQSNHRNGIFGNIETAVILTLSSFVAGNILDILKELKNITNSYSPGPKVLYNEKLSSKRNIHISQKKRFQKMESTNIQNIFNGTYKCCRNCHLVIICGIIGMDSDFYIRKKNQSDSICENICCIQYEKKSRKYTVSQKNEHCYEKSKIVKRKHSTEGHFCSPNYKVFSPNCFWKSSYKDISNEDVDGIFLKMRIAITSNAIKDIRRCILCKQKGDSFADGPSRLLNYDVNKWVHLNCALWSNNVYETINGGLMNLEIAIQQGLHQICKFCNQYGASLKCFKMRCGHAYHLPCAIKEQCIFYKNKTIHCASHAHRIEKKNELSSVRVRRRVYIERDENRQVAAVMHHLELSNLLRIGNLILINIGQLLPHQLEAFHTPNYIYPIGYKIIRFFWSTRYLNKRCRYICSILESNCRPEFIIQIQEQHENDIEIRDLSPKAVWQRVLEKIVMLRKRQTVVQLFSEFFTGEDLFGLSEPSIVKILESLPGVESLTDYRFKYGRNPLLELPLALNPSGSARTEPKQRHNMNWKKTHTQRTSSVNPKLSLSPSSVAGEVACPYSKQFVHSKSSQYRKMKQEWRNNVYLARSKIQGLGLYAARDLEKHTMVIEYIGQVIRTEVSELREKQYDLRNRGIYMFRLDEERVVDATLSGGLARYINHSCNPNCVTEIVDVDREYRIIIFAKRKINKGEELSYDYKFDIEDDAHKISCMCDAPNCRKWMN